MVMNQKQRNIKGLIKPMKNLIKILILSFILLTSFIFSQQKVNINNLIEYGQKKFYQDQDEPYTGMVFDIYKSNGQKKLEGFYSNGFRDGKWIEYYETGRKEYLGNYKDGYRHGKWTWYYTNGQISEEGNYKKGQKEGVWR